MVRVQVLGSDFLESNPTCSIYYVNINSITPPIITKMETTVAHTSKDSDKDKMPKNNIRHLIESWNIMFNRYKLFKKYFQMLVYRFK